MFLFYLFQFTVICAASIVIIILVSTLLSSLLSPINCHCNQFLQHQPFVVIHLDSSCQSTTLAVTVIIENVPKFNYLGIIIDEHLSWNSHIEMIRLKVSKAIGIINHLKSIYPQRVLFTLYNSLIISYMLYSILLWGKSDNVDKIAKLQKRAIRTISFSRPIAHIEPLFKTFNLLKFNDIDTLKLINFFTNSQMIHYLHILLRIKL